MGREIGQREGAESRPRERLRVILDPVAHEKHPALFGFGREGDVEELAHRPELEQRPGADGRALRRIRSAGDPGVGRPVQRDADGETRDGVAVHDRAIDPGSKCLERFLVHCSGRDGRDEEKEGGSGKALHSLVLVLNRRPPSPVRGMR